jgi:hypothetical protein
MNVALKKYTVLKKYTDMLNPAGLFQDRSDSERAIV